MICNVNQSGNPASLHSALTVWIVYPSFLAISFRKMYYQNVNQCWGCQLFSSGFIRSLPTLYFSGFTFYESEPSSVQFGGRNRL